MQVGQPCLRSFRPFGVGTGGGEVVSLALPCFVSFKLAFGVVAGLVLLKCLLGGLL